MSADCPKESSTSGVEHPLFVIMKWSRNKYHYAVKRVQKENYIMKGNTLIESCINKEKNIFSEIKKL